MAKAVPKQASIAKPESAKERRLQVIVFSFAIVVIALHLYGAYVPSGMNWGVHLLGFFSLPIQVVWLALACAMLFPQIQQKLLKALRLLSELITRWGPGKMFILFGVLFILAAWFFRERIYLLGDGSIVLRHISSNESPIFQDKFSREPLTGFLHWWLHTAVLTKIGFQEPELAFVMIDMLCGLVFIVLLFRLAGILTRTTSDKLLVIGFILSAATSQFFFGYVEDYTLLYVAMLGYLYASLLYLQGRVSLLVPSLLFGVMFPLQFGIVLWLPSLLLLYWHAVRRSEWKKVGGAVAAVIGTAGGLLVGMGYTWNAWLNTFARESHVVPLGHTESDWQSYTMFSVKHLLDVLNAQLLVAPFALFLIVMVLGSYFRKIDFRDRTLRFLGVTALCSLLLLWVFNPDIGASRDWDVLGVWQLSCLTLAVFVIMRYVAVQQMRVVLLVATFLTGLNTIVCIVVNASETRGVQRFEMLMDERLWSRNAMRQATNDLARYYQSFKQDYQSAGRVHIRFLKLFPDDNHGFRDAAFFYLEVKDTALAYQQFVKASQVGTSQERAGSFDNLGVFHVQYRRDFLGGISYFHRALASDSSYTVAYWNIGKAWLVLGDTTQAVQFMTKYLSADPKGVYAKVAREALREIGKR
jgi:Tfp pilus assembly protein PilF